MTKPKGFRIHNYNNNYTSIVVSYGSLRTLICLKRTRRRLVWAFFGWKVAQFWTLIFLRRGACSTRCPEVISGTVDDRNCGGDVWNSILAIYVQLMLSNTYIKQIDSVYVIYMINYMFYQLMQHVVYPEPHSYVLLGMCDTTFANLIGQRSPHSRDLGI